MLWARTQGARCPMAFGASPPAHGLCDLPCRLRSKRLRMQTSFNPSHDSEPAAAAASQEQQLPADTGLAAFKSLIAEKRFICTQCGKCCTGDGEVWITDDEAVNIARYLNTPLKRFLTQYTRGYSKVVGFKVLRAKPDSEIRDCTFLRPDNTCAIHPVRPLQCSTYPWWPDLMSDRDWSWEKENICEGFDHPDAPPTDLADAARQLKTATALEYRKILAYKPSRKQLKQAAAVVPAVVDSSSSSANRKQARPTTVQKHGGSDNSSDGPLSSAATQQAPTWQKRLHRLQKHVVSEADNLS